MRPVLFYVDDQDMNLVVFKGICLKEWDIYTFNNPVEALKALSEKRPWVIISDQMMPQMKGFEFLEICKTMLPDAVRIVMTAYSDESLLVASLRSAQITDLIRKPWEVSEVIARISAGIAHYEAIQQARNLSDSLRLNQQELKESNDKLNQALRELTIAQKREAQIRYELESWVPKMIVEAIERGRPLEGIKNDVAKIVFDIKGSAALFGQNFNGVPLRNHVIQLFTEALAKNRGVRESVSGDSAYGHFGLLVENNEPAESALSAAFEFVAAVKSLARLSSHPLTVGVALHFTSNTALNIHTSLFQSESEQSALKTYDTSSVDTDLVHRIEKVAHRLTGKNIIMSKRFFEQLETKPEGIIELPQYSVPGLSQPQDLYLIPDSRVTKEELEQFKKTG